MFVHLHVRSWFSFQAGVSSPEALVAEAARLGMPALALTDVDGVYGAVRFQQACRKHGIEPILGAEIRIGGWPLVFLVRNRSGYARLCALATRIHTGEAMSERSGMDSAIALLRETEADGLHCLTGGEGSLLWNLVDAERETDAVAWIDALRSLFGPHLSIEATHHLDPGDTLRVNRLVRLAAKTGVPLVATGDVRYAVPADYRRYDLMTCSRLNITVFEPHPERPRNAEAFLRSEDDLRRLIPYPEAFRRAVAIAQDCQVDLLPEGITPPAARLPEGKTAHGYLLELCLPELDRRYPRKAAYAKARAQFDKEVAVLNDLDLEDFFLVVHEVVSESRRRGIRCAGRGSAANSIVAYLLGITGVDPLRHRLLFERFLHRGRKGTPDIDVDFDSERREEIIAWMEERFGMAQTAMTATLIHYRLRSAVRDVARAFGWPIETVNKLSKAAPPRGAARVAEFRVQLEQVVGASPLLALLIEMVESLAECPRHLGQHSGGMVLSRRPLNAFTPIQVSANGVKVVQFDKDDVEALGLVKFDVLGLRMLATVAEAVELVERHEGVECDIDDMPLDDIRTFNLMRAGKTLGVFQIESQGQLHLLAQNQPECFDDLVTEVALFRPGPVQGGMVPPFIRRRRGMEPVTYEHPSLAPILADTYGIILFQEQILEIAHQFAGMSLEEADEFRRLMSKFRDPGEMEAMRGQFVAGAMRHQGASDAVAQSIFNKVAGFVGYGFCRSHAAAFAKTVYQSAYLKCHHPAAYMAAVMQHRPGMYSLMTLEEEARRFGAETLLPDINRSGVRYDLERLSDGRLAIRKPLTSVVGLSENDARAILWERLLRPFTSVEDVFRRLTLGRDVMRNLARSGAFDALAGDSRRAFWMVGLLERRAGVAGQVSTPTLFDLPLITPADVPDLPVLSENERLEWDLQMHNAARRHPMTLLRRALNDIEIRPIETCYRMGRTYRIAPGAPMPVVTLAGITIMRQRPPTAKGVMFLTLEDETGFIQCVIRPQVIEALDHVLRSAGLIVRGELHAQGNWRGLILTQAWRLDGIFGGYEGHPWCDGGRDTWVRGWASRAPNSERAPVPPQTIQVNHDRESLAPR